MSVCELNNHNTLNSLERRQYEESQKEYWDYTSTLQTAEKKGRAEGRAEGLAEGIEKGLAEGKRDMARKMKSYGMSVEVIEKYTGLTIDEIKSL